MVVKLLPARASEQDRVISLVSVYMCKKNCNLVVSEQSERASISSVKWKSDIYIFVCMYTMYSFFLWYVHARVYDNLDSVMNSTFHAGGCSPD